MNLGGTPPLPVPAVCRVFAIEMTVEQPETVWAVVVHKKLSHYDKSYGDHV